MVVRGRGKCACRSGVLSIRTREKGASSHVVCKIMVTPHLHLAPRQVQKWANGIARRGGIGTSSQHVNVGGHRVMNYRHRVRQKVCKRGCGTSILIRRSGGVITPGVGGQVWCGDSALRPHGR